MVDLNKKKGELYQLSKEIEAMNAEISSIADDASVEMLNEYRCKAYDLLARFAEMNKDIAKLELEAEREKVERSKALYDGEKEELEKLKRQLEIVNRLKKRSEKDME